MNLGRAGTSQYLIGIPVLFPGDVVLSLGIIIVRNRGFFVLPTIPPRPSMSEVDTVMVVIA